MSEAVDTELRQKFIGGMSHAACTVNIVTTDGELGRAGVTVSAMSSVSADTPKPTLLVCVHYKSVAAERIIGNGVFCVNVLRDDQSYISDTFAGRFKDQIEDKFECAEWTIQATGAPRVVDPLVSFDCRLISSDKVGTHYVFFGEVEDIFLAEKGSPLIYANRAYGTASRIDPAVSIGAGKEAADAVLSIGCVHTFGPFILPQLIARQKKIYENLELSLTEGNQRRVQESLLAGETELVFLYDLDIADGLRAEALTALTPYVLLAEGHSLSTKAALTLQDLSDQPMVLLNVHPSSEYFLGMLRKEGIEPKIAYRSASFEMVRGMVGNGLGYTLLATKPASAMSYDGKALIARPLVSQVDVRSIVVVTREGVPLSMAAENFIGECRSFFSS